MDGNLEKPKGNSGGRKKPPIYSLISLVQPKDLPSTQQDLLNPSEHSLNPLISNEDFSLRPYQSFRGGVEISQGMHSAIILEPLLQPEEALFEPDLFSFIALPLSPDASPGTERERIHTGLRSTHPLDRAQIELTRNLMQELPAKLKSLMDKGYTWRWVTVEAPHPQGLNRSVEIYLKKYHVDFEAGEGLSFIAVSKQTPKSPQPPELPSGK